MSSFWVVMYRAKKIPIIIGQIIFKGLGLRMMIKKAGPTRRHKTWGHITEDVIVWESTVFLNGEVQLREYVSSPPNRLHVYVITVDILKELLFRT